MRKFTALLLATATLLVLSCKEPTAVVPELKLLSSDEVSIPREGGDTYIKFETNVAWTASVSQTKWATISKTSGREGTVSIKATLLMNGSDDERSCEVTIKAEDKIAVVKIKQNQRDAIYIEPLEYHVDGLEQKLDVKVLSNTGYTAESKVDWIKVVNTKACVESTLTLDIAANDKYEQREGTVLVKGAESMVLNIIQDAKIPVFKINGKDSDVICGIAKTGGVASISVSTNVSYTWEQSEKPWISISAAKDQFDANIDVNAAYAPRQAYIKFIVPDIQDPILDDHGKETGKTKDHEVYAFFNQEGYSQLIWQKSISSLNGMDSKPGAIHRLAITSNQLGLSDGKSIYFLDSSNGNILSTLSCPAASLATDDAGNMLVADEGINGETFKVYSLAKDGTKTEYINLKYDATTSTALSNLRIKGNLGGNAVITALNDQYPSAAIWEVKDGTLQDGCTIFPLHPYQEWEEKTGLRWSSTRNGCIVPQGNLISDGMVYLTYDGDNELYFITENNVIYSSKFFGNRAQENYNCIATASWNGSEYVAFEQGQLFASGKFPDLYLFNKESRETEYFDHTLFGIETRCVGTRDGQNASSDIAMAIENGNLAVYVVDGLADVIYKIVVKSIN